MRTIKFRAWHKKRMYPVWNIYFWYDKTKDMTVGLWDKGVPFATPVKNVILMQYTGLKDKKGKEIYEGDLMKGLSGDGKAMMLFEIYYGEFKMEHRMKYFKPKKDERHDFFLSSGLGKEVEKLEVIGNVFENKELLK